MNPTGHTRQSSEQIVEAILPDVRKGRMVILVDDEDRENEGDLFVAAERATPEAINFMANEGRGMVSLALTEQRVRALGLQLITDDTGNTTRFAAARHQNPAHRGPDRIPAQRTPYPAPLADGAADTACW